MSILVNKDTRIIVQGITGGQGAFHTEQMINYGANVVAGVVPGKGGLDFNGIPIYDTVDSAMDEMMLMLQSFLYRLHSPQMPCLKLSIHHLNSSSPLLKAFPLTI